MNAESSIRVPDASPAVLALAAAWMACVDDHHVCDTPRFSINASNILDIAEAADVLEHRPKPVWLTPVQSRDVLAVSTQQTPAPEHHTDPAISGALLTEGPPDE